MTTNATKRLAEFSAGLRYEDLPKATVRMTKQCILDWLGVALRGSMERPAEILREAILPADGATDAAVLGTKGTRAAAMNAAFLNGAASHTLDFDDLHNASIIHIATVSVPPVFATAEKEHKGGRDMLAAVAAGYEVAARVGEAVNPESYYFWHTTGTVGTISAAVSAARVLGLTPEQTIHAIGSAGTQAAGLWEFVKEGAMSKPLHTGKACYGGVLSAYLARAGFTGATRILEGEKGFCRAMAAKPHLEKLTEGLGEGFKIDENSFKPYPCCKHSHAAIYAALELRREHGFSADDAARVTILVNDITDSLINNPNPTTAYGCKFSLQYCVACALRYGKVGLEHFSPAEMENADTRRFMENISVKRDAAVQAVYDADSTKLASKVVVELKDGRVWEKAVDYPKGDPANPMTWEDSREKFLALADPVVGREAAGRLAALVDALEEAEDLSAALREIL